MQKDNGPTARMGYLEVKKNVICPKSMQISPLLDG
jgi:hypothetical protein